jgi:hypothetical protein
VGRRHTTWSAFAPWAPIILANLLAIADLTPPLSTQVFISSGVMATGVTWFVWRTDALSDQINQALQQAIQRAPVAAAMRYGYKLALEHCEEHLARDGATGRLTADGAYGSPYLRLVEPAGTVYASAAADPDAVTAEHHVAVDPVVELSSRRPSPRHRRPQ